MENVKVVVASRRKLLPFLVTARVKVVAVLKRKALHFPPQPAMVRVMDVVKEKDLLLRSRAVVALVDLEVKSPQVVDPHLTLNSRAQA